PLQLQKIIKDYVFKKPNPSSTIHTQLSKTWATFHFSIQENEKELINQEESINSNNNSILINSADIIDMELDTLSR
ncbi:23291_t:CDS:2, partial [Gigaspora margarita]